jgi:hypothetical protein
VEYRSTYLPDSAYLPAYTYWHDLYLLILLTVLAYKLILVLK